MRGVAAPLPAEALGFTPASPSRSSSENSASSPADTWAAGSATGADAFANRCPGFFGAGAAADSATGSAPVAVVWSAPAVRVPAACEPTGAAWLGAGVSSPALNGAPQNGQHCIPSSTGCPQNGHSACLELIDQSFPNKNGAPPSSGARRRKAHRCTSVLRRAYFSSFSLRFLATTM